MKAEIIKIHAEGTNKRFMTIVLETGFVTSLRISQNLYLELRNNGVITSQKLRYIKKK